MAVMLYMIKTFLFNMSLKNGEAYNCQFLSLLTDSGSVIQSFQPEVNNFSIKIAHFPYFCSKFHS